MSRLCSIRIMCPEIPPVTQKSKVLLEHASLSRHSGGSTVGEGGDKTISSPGRSPKQPLSGIGLHDPLHGRQAYPEFIAFDQGVGQICPR